MSLVLPTRRPLSNDDAIPVTADNSQTRQFPLLHQPDLQCHPVSASPSGTTDVGRPSVNSVVATSRSCADDEVGGGGRTQRIPDSVWSEFTETFRVIELAVSEGLRCSIDAPPATFQPELEMSVDLPPADRDNRQYSLQLTRRDVSARRQREYDVTCAAVARRRDGDDVRYAVSYNRWIKVARQPAAVARQPAMYEASHRQTYDTNVVGVGDHDYKPKGECLWAGCVGANETSEPWTSTWPAVKQEQPEERPSCAYQFWRNDSDPSQSLVRSARFRSAIPNEFKDCRYAAVSHNKVHKIPCSVFLLLVCYFLHHIGTKSLRKSQM